jgi:phage terminase Nu1 subunit (DNA packaging protein)
VTPATILLAFAVLFFVLAGFQVGRKQGLLVEWWAFACLVIWLLVGKVREVGGNLPDWIERRLSELRESELEQLRADLRLRALDQAERDAERTRRMLKDTRVRLDREEFYRRARNDG